VACQRVRVPKMTHSDALEDFAESGKGMMDAQWYRDKAKEIRGTIYDSEHEEHWMTMCGEGKAAPQCECGALADYLCDYPIGKGKTCDLPMCREHRNQIGTDRDLCLIHLAEFRGKAGVGRINEWPPARPAAKVDA
jgi:hypothetical protein